VLFLGESHPEAFGTCVLNGTVRRHDQGAVRGRVLPVLCVVRDAMWAITGSVAEHLGLLLNREATAIRQATCVMIAAGMDANNQIARSPNHMA